MTASAFDFIRIDLLCPTCGETDKQLLKEMAKLHAIECRYCGAPIDLSSKEWRERIASETEDYKSIKPV